MAKITMGDRTLEARGIKLDFDTLRNAFVETRAASGVYTARLGQPAPAARSNCVNCGAPHEPVCSYCGTRR